MSRLYLDDMKGRYYINMLSVHSMPRDKARNTLVQSALDDGADYIVFLDDDNIVPFDFIQQLLDTNEDIVGLNYGFKKPYYESVHLINEYNHSIPKDATGLIETKRCFAVGACLIKREVFENIGFPWFQE
jgi:GT2 family glycosyltransferase